MNTRILKRIRKKTKITIRVSPYHSTFYDIFVNGVYKTSHMTLSLSIDCSWREVKCYGLTSVEKKILSNRQIENNVVAYRNY